MSASALPVGICAGIVRRAQEAAAAGLGRVTPEEQLRMELDQLSAHVAEGRWQDACAVSQMLTHLLRGMILDTPADAVGVNTQTKGLT